MLEEYSKKRKFEKTKEPKPRGESSAKGELTFVVQKHDARRLHYDFRLEWDGVLKSWAVPKGPSLNPKEKRLAVLVEDHPLEYANFEGSIPKGEYGAGEVIVWDKGTYYPDEGGIPQSREEAEQKMREGFENGKLSFTLRGHKLRGSWALVRMKKSNEWLLIKHKDEFASEEDILEKDESVISGLRIEDIRAGKDPIPLLEKIKGAKQKPFIWNLKPMLAHTAEKPFSHPDWVFEPKLDGLRILAFVQGEKVILRSRNARDVTKNYPSLTKILSSLGLKGAVFDGEVVAFDSRGNISFQQLQKRMNLVNEHDIALAEKEIPVVYYIFDLLYWDEYDVRDAPWKERRKLLELVSPKEQGINLVQVFEEDGEAAYEGAISKGLEGILAKKIDSRYESGVRSSNWLKIKSFHSGEFVICGYTQGRGSRAKSLGALVLGKLVDGEFVHVGNVGTGFDEPTIVALMNKLEPLKDKCPFKSPPLVTEPVTWVKPVLVAEVKYTHYTEGGALRSPVFLRLREDIEPSEAVAEEIVAEIPGKEPELVSEREIEEVLEQLKNQKQEFRLRVGEYQFDVTNLDKVLWPEDGKGFTKRDFITYLAKIAKVMLPHIRNRPLTLSRYPDGIYGETFYQKHWEFDLPPFVETVKIFSSHREGALEYLLANNLASLLWLGQLANLEIHTWYSRIKTKEEEPHGADYWSSKEALKNSSLNYPDFMVFDLDPYVESDITEKEKRITISKEAFQKLCDVAFWLKEELEGISLKPYVKTSGKRGLHIFVPIVRNLSFEETRNACESVALYVLKKHPKEITTEYAIERRIGKVFIDYNQNMRGKTLASVYSPRAYAGAPVSVPLLWEELRGIHPLDFDIETTAERVKEKGDVWEDILRKPTNLRDVLNL